VSKRIDKDLEKERRDRMKQVWFHSEEKLKD